MLWIILGFVILVAFAWYHTKVVSALREDVASLEDHVRALIGKIDSSPK